MSLRLISTIIIALLVLSFLPSLERPYRLDDYDILRELNLRDGSPRLITYFFFPYNEHLVPIPKLLYYFCFKYFRLNAVPFHLVLGIFYFSLLFITYRLLAMGTKSNTAAAVGTFLFGLSDMYIFTFTSMSLSFVLISFTFMALLWYSVGRSAYSERPVWQAVSFCATVCAALTFGMGVFSFFTAVLFYFLFLYDGKTRNIRCLGSSCIGFLIIGALYCVVIKDLTHVTPSGFAFGDIRSFVARIDILQGVRFGVKATFQYLIPHFAFNRAVSFSLFASFLLSIFLAARAVRWKHLSFFAFLILFNYTMVYLFRHHFGEELMLSIRYHLVPAFGLAGLYATGFAALLETKERYGQALSRGVLMALLVFGTVSTMQRLDHMNRYIIETGTSSHFFSELQSCIGDYLESTDVQRLTLRNDLIQFPRHIYFQKKPLSFFAEIVLPQEIRDRLVWGDTTDASFAAYLSMHGDAYPAMRTILTGGGADKNR